MPKLLQINATVNWGSTGRIAEQIGLAAMARGWESYIAYGRNFRRSASQTVKVGSRLDVGLHVLKSRLCDAAGLGSSIATRRLIRKIEKIQPDIVHLHNIHGYYLNYKVLADYLAGGGIKVVWTFHDCWAFTGHCAHFVQADCEKWRYGCHSCPLKKEYPESWLADRSEANYSLKKRLFGRMPHLTVVSVSEWIDDLVGGSFLKDRSGMVIHNGVDVDVFMPKDGPDGKVFRLLAVSNIWNAGKGLYDLFELRKILPDTYEICIVGLSDSQTRQLPEGVRGVARTQSVEELVKLYSSSDVLINPTYADTFPTVNLEALACGTPVITYRTGGSPEAIDEKTGIVVEQGDVQGLAEAVMRLRKQPLSREDCRARAEKHFDKDKCFEKYISLYESLLAEKM